MVESSLVCSSCGADSVPKKARFCPNCGSPVNTTSSSSSSSSDAVPMVPAVPVAHHNNNNLGVSAVSAIATPSASTSSITTSFAVSVQPVSATPVSLDTSAPREDFVPTATPAATANAIDNTAASGSTGGCTGPVFVKPFNSNNNNTADNNNDDNNNNNNTSPETAIFWKNPTPTMLDRAAKYTAMGGILFLSSGCNKGKFTLPKTIHVGQILMGQKLDLSIADFVHPISTISVGTILGGFKVIVPRGVRVETNGIGILGGFKGMQSQTVNAGHVEDAPLVILQGVAILGGTKVVVNRSVPPVQIVP